METTKTRNVRKGKLNDDTILEMVELVEQGYSVRDVSEKYKVHYTTVYKYIKEFGISVKDKRKKAVKTVEKVTEPEVESIKKPIVKKPIKKSVNPYRAPKIINCGLIKDRHEMPVDQFIFEFAIRSSLMFNYDKLDQMIRDWINEKIPFIDDPFEPGKKVGSAILQVYMTGLTCCTASLIKVCNEMRVNLRLCHYDFELRKYHTQIIWNSFGRDPRLVLPNPVTEINFVDCKLDDIIDKDFYVLSINSNDGVRLSFFKEMNGKVMDHYKEAVEVQFTSKEKINVFLNKGIIRNSSLFYTDKVFSSLSGN